MAIGSSTVLGSTPLQDYPVLSGTHVQTLVQPSLPMLQLNHDGAVPLVNQIVDGISGRVDAQTLKPGARMPSIRALAVQLSVSVFTVVQAYDRLVARGVLESRASAGFFVQRIGRHDAHGEASVEAHDPPRFDAIWYLKQIFESGHLPHKPGCGWLPEDHLFEDGVRRALRRLASEGLRLSGYGDPRGLVELRRLLTQTLAQEHLIQVSTAQVLLCHGSSQGLDLATRTLLSPGDTVLVDDPGYPNLMSMLRIQGARLIGVPRTPDGYDMDALEGVLKTERPKAFFTQPRLQSPTGSRASPAQLHQLLSLAERHDFMLVENDIYADMDTGHQTSLASFGQWERVIHLGSFSKTIAPNLRVGHLLASIQMVEQLAELKMLAGLSSSEVSERLVCHVIEDGRWRRHLRGLRDRLASGHDDVAARLLALGFELFCEPREGMYLWARHPAVPDAREMVQAAADDGILLGLGQLFTVAAEPCGWLRFNVAFSQLPAVGDWLERWLRR